VILDADHKCNIFILGLATFYVLRTLPPFLRRQRVSRFTAKLNDRLPSLMALFLLFLLRPTLSNFEFTDLAKLAQITKNLSLLFDEAIYQDEAAAKEKMKAQNEHLGALRNNTDEHKLFFRLVPDIFVDPASTAQANAMRAINVSEPFFSFYVNTNMNYVTVLLFDVGDSVARLGRPAAITRAGSKVFGDQCVSGDWTFKAVKKEITMNMTLPPGKKQHIVCFPTSPLVDLLTPNSSTS
jgi:hypothetical protein